MSDLSEVPQEIWEALLRRAMREEAEASVRLDTEGDVHTCYEGHCSPRESEGKK